VSTAGVDVLAAGPVAGGGRSRYGRWLLALVVAAVAVTLLAPVIRLQMDRSGLRRLETVWAQRGATHDALFAAVGTLHGGAAPQDMRMVRRAVAALQREDASGLHRLRRAAATTRAYGATRGLRSAVAAALAAEEHALLSSAAAGSEVDPVQLEVTTWAQRVESDLVVLRRRLHVSTSRVAPVRLHAADSALQRLSRLMDTPLPVRLLVNGPGGPALLDLASNRVVPRPDVPDVTGGLLRGGFLVTVIPPRVLAVPLDGGTATPIADNADAVLPGPREGELWLGEPATAVLVDLTGRVLRRVALPADLRAAVSSALVIGDEQLSVWDPIRRRTVRRLPQCTNLVASGGDEVALSACFGDAARRGAVHVVDARTGRDRAIRLPAGLPHVVSGSLAPDGRRLAIVALPSDGEARLLVADLQTGAVTAVQTPGASTVSGGQVWAPDSTRLFFDAGSSFDAPAASLWTYGLGHRAATAIRYLRRGPVTPLAALQK